MDLTAKGYSLKLDQSGADQVNQLITDNNLDPENFKELFYSLLQIATASKEVVKPEFSEEIVNAIEIYKVNKGLSPENEAKTDTLIVDALTTIITKEVEVIKDVPTELKENEYVVELSPERMETLKEIATNRKTYSDKYSKNLELEPPLVVLTKMAFIKGTLNNWGGNFYTGRG